MIAGRLQATFSGSLGGTFRPPIALASGPVSTVFGGLEEDLYQDALVRRRRQQQREEEALAQQRECAKPKISSQSRAICKDLLAREIHQAFATCGGIAAVQDGCEVQAILRSRLSLVFECMGFLSGGEGEEAFLAQLALLLDKEKNGIIGSRRLLSFVLRAIDRHESQAKAPGTPCRNRPAVSTEEECFDQLEQRLLRSFGRLLTNRLHRPRSSSRGLAAAVFPPRSHRSEGTPRRGRSPSPRSDARPEPMEGGHPGATPVTSAQRLRRRSEASAIAAKRCHLLYQQAVFASKEADELQEEVKELKLLQEMRECTFHPKILPSSRGSSPREQPRNFDMAIARMRCATRRREEQQEELMHVPVGENYARLRRLGAKPFSCYYKERTAVNRAPLVYVDVNVGKGKTGRIGVHEGDNLRELAWNFAKAFQLGAEMRQRLEVLLQQAVEAVDEPVITPGCPAAPMPCSQSPHAASR